MKGLGPAQKVLGMEIERDRAYRKLYLSQEKYIENVHHRYQMESTRPVTSPLGAHFKLNEANFPSTDEDCAMTSTRPDIAYAVNMVSWYMANLG